MLSWESSTMDCPFTAEMRSPTFSFPHWSAGLPSITRPILWGITAESEQAHQLFQSTVNIPVRRALSRARAPRSAQSRSCSERWQCSEKPVEDKGGLTQQSECRARGCCTAVIPALLSPASFFEGSGRWGTSCTCQDYQLTFQNHASKAETRSQQPPKIKKPSRTVLMSPCRSYCEATDIDAF